MSRYEWTDGDGEVCHVERSASGRLTWYGGQEARTAELLRLAKENERLRALAVLALEDADRARKWCQRLLPAAEAHKAITSLDRAICHLEAADQGLRDHTGAPGNSVEIRKEDESL